MEPESRDPMIGRIIGRMQIEELLGSGATGQVYRARHLTLEKPVAIKILHASHTQDPSLVRRFRAEARAASRLEHPNSVRIYDFDEDGPDLYIAMELLDGGDLESVLEREPVLDAHRIAGIMVQVCSALGVAHEHGIIHRDVKPGNIMLVLELDEEGVFKEVVKVCDFGLAKILDANPNASGGPLTKQGMIFGTPTYMSPEQAGGEPIDHRTDVYSCGIIMYRMATGAPPFSAENATGLLMKQIMSVPDAVLVRNPRCNPRIAAVVERAIAKRPEHRYQTMQEMARDLREILAETTPTPEPAPAIGTVEVSGFEDTLVRDGLPAVLPPPEIPRRERTLSSPFTEPLVLGPRPKRSRPSSFVLTMALAVLVGGFGAFYLPLRAEPDQETVIPKEPTSKEPTTRQSGLKRQRRRRRRLSEAATRILSATTSDPAPTSSVADVPAAGSR